jgi:hypothetical protein
MKFAISGGVTDIDDDEGDHHHITDPAAPLKPL